MIDAIVLAAGQSRRMERNKMLLPFGASTVIEAIVSEIAACVSIHDLVVVTGYEHERVAALLSRHRVRCVFNPAYAQAGMLVSIQVGLRTLNVETTAALIALGDQPGIQHDVVQRVTDAHAPDTLVIPSYRMQRGHPILIDRALWPGILSLPPSAILRDYVRAHAAQIRYVEVETDSILRDVDTLEDYDDLIHRGGAEDAENHLRERK